MTDRVSPDELPSALEPIVRERIPGARKAKIVNWKRTERGFSTETYLFELDGAEHTSAGYVFRRPPEVALFPDYDLRRQYLVTDRLTPTGLAVPRVRWIEDGDTALGTPYYVMDRIADAEAPSDFPSYHTAGSYFDADERGRAKMWWGCMETMAQIHRLDHDRLRLGFLAMPEFGEQPVEQAVNYLDWAVHWASPSLPPVMERALTWLRENLYEPEHVTLCWGDARMSNILYARDHTVAGVLDWEMAYLGDHEADLAWLLFLDWACSDFEGHPRLPGTPNREETIARYEELTGRPVRNLRFNEVLAAVLLSVPLLRLSTHLQVGEHADISAFCIRRLEDLLGGAQP
ncbi:phosphotransferase family protein [Rhodococcus daqingensis]|uniref:Phosphotransferase family protein n=1 Tax=Rhodococcus daqingensis TaxID=2479363 RepID=A0ABW2S5E9_9NOCA